MKTLGFQERTLDEFMEKFKSVLTSKNSDQENPSLQEKVGGTSSMHFFDDCIIKQIKVSELLLYCDHFTLKQDHTELLLKYSPKVYGILVDTLENRQYLFMENALFQAPQASYIDLKLGQIYLSSTHEFSDQQKRIQKTYKKQSFQKNFCVTGFKKGDILINTNKTSGSSSQLNQKELTPNDYSIGLIIESLPVDCLEPYKKQHLKYLRWVLEALRGIKEEVSKIRDSVLKAMELRKMELYATSLFVFMDWKNDKYGVKLIDFGGCQQYPEQVVSEFNDLKKAYGSVIEDIDANLVAVKSQIGELEKIFPDLK